MRQIIKPFKVLLLLLFLCTIHVESYAQTANLRQARIRFDEGKIQDIEALLKTSLDRGDFNDEEEIEAYRLLILSYIYLDETEKADNAMLSLLKSDPGFEINNQADPAELINLYNTFRHDPIFFWGARLGLNNTFTNVINAYGVHDLNNTTGSYTGNIGYGGGLMLEKKLGARITAKTDFQYLINSFNHENSFLLSAEDRIPILESTVTETQTMLSATLMGQYSFFRNKNEGQKRGFQKWNPYVGLGISANLITGSLLSFDVKNSEGASPDGSDEDLLDVEIRKSFNPTAELELGFKKALGLNYFNVGLRYSYGLLNITDKHYVNGPLTTFFGWAANDINTHSASFFVGILIPHYVPKKLIK